MSITAPELMCRRVKYLEREYEENFGGRRGGERAKEGRRRRKQVNKTDRVYLLACRQWFYFTDGATVHGAGGLFLIIVSKLKGQQFIP